MSCHFWERRNQTPQREVPAGSIWMWKAAAALVLRILKHLANNCLLKTKLSGVFDWTGVRRRDCFIKIQVIMHKTAKERQLDFHKIHTFMHSLYKTKCCGWNLSQNLVYTLFWPNYKATFIINRECNSQNALQQALWNKTCRLLLH